MPRFVIKNHKAIWETTTIEVEAPDVAHVEAHRDQLIAAALDDGTADMTSGDAVEDVADEYEVYDERGTCVAGSGSSAALLLGRRWRATYRICALDGDQIGIDTVKVSAQSTTEATTKAIAWVHDNDPRCDPRIDYLVEITQLEPVKEGEDDDEDDPAG